MNPIDVFKKFDTDNSGYIDKKELFEGLKELYKITNNEKSLCNDIFVFADGCLITPEPLVENPAFLH